jgi:hypothetical protein
MALLARILASFQAAAPVSSLTPLDNELNQLTGANGALNGGSTSNRILTKYSHATEPVLELDQLGAGLILQGKQNGVQKFAVANSGAIQTSSTTLVTNLNADTVDGQHASAFAASNARVAFSFSAGIPDPTVAAVAPLAVVGAPIFVCPNNTTVVITHVHVAYMVGSHTSGGTLTVAWQKRSAAGAWADPTVIGSVSLNNTNSTIFIPYTTDIADVPLAPGDTLELFITARSGTITERSVTAAVWGTQQVF